MKVKLELEVEVRDADSLKRHVYDVMYSGTPAEEVNDMLGSSFYDSPVSAMVMEALVANGDAAPLDMGIEIMNYEAKIIG